MNTRAGDLTYHVHIYFIQIPQTKDFLQYFILSSYHLSFMIFMQVSK